MGGWWASVGAAYDRGGESKIDGVRKDDSKQDLLFGVSAGVSVNPRSSIKIAYVGHRTGESIGSDTDNLALAFSIRF